MIPTSLKIDKLSKRLLATGLCLACAALPSISLADKAAITSNQVSFTATGFSATPTIQADGLLNSVVANVPPASINNNDGLTVGWSVSPVAGDPVTDGTYTFDVGFFIDQDGANRRIEIVIPNVNLVFSGNNLTGGSVAANTGTKVYGRANDNVTSVQTTINNSSFTINNNSLSVDLGNQLTKIAGGGTILNDLINTFTSTAPGHYNFGVMMKQTGTTATGKIINFSLADGTSVLPCVNSDVTLISGNSADFTGASAIQGEFSMQGVGGANTENPTAFTGTCSTSTAAASPTPTPEPAPSVGASASPSASPSQFCPAGQVFNNGACVDATATNQVSSAATALTTLESDLNDLTKTAEELNAAIVASANTAIGAAAAAVASIDAVLNSGSGEAIDSNLINNTAALLNNLVTALGNAAGRPGVTVDSTQLKSTLRSQAKLLQQLQSAAPLTADEKVTRANQLKDLVSSLKKLVNEPVNIEFSRTFTFPVDLPMPVGCSVNSLGFTPSELSDALFCDYEDGSDSVVITGVIPGKYSGQPYSFTYKALAFSGTADITVSGVFASNSTLTQAITLDGSSPIGLGIGNAVLDPDDIGFTRDALSSTADIVNANIALGVDIDFETVGLLEGLVDDGLSRALDAIGESVDTNLDLAYSDPASTRSLLGSDARLLGPTLDVVGINLVSNNGAGQAIVEDNLESSGVASDNAAALAADLAGFRNPEGITLAAATGTVNGEQALINAAGVTATGSYDSTAATVVLNTTALGGTEQNVPLYVQSTKLVSQSFPAGLSTLPDGRIVAISDGLASTVAPGLVDVVNFAAAVSAANATLDITDQGNFLITGADFLLSGSTGFAGQAPGNTGGTVSFVVTGDDPASADFAFIANYAGGASQAIVPTPGDNAFYSVLENAGFRISTDRATGILTIDGSNAETIEGLLPAGGVSRFRTDFFLERLSFFGEDILFRSQVNQQEAAFRPVDANGDGIMDYRIIYGTNYQVLYGLP